MFVTSVVLKQFRCFDSLSLSFDSPIVVIEGGNGAGKTSVLEALYYTGHLKSFKTSTPKELIHHTHEAFFIKVNGKSEDEWSIQAGYSHHKKSVKINETSVKTYQELYSAYKVISITEDDLHLVQGAPEVRRSFLDQILCVESIEYRTLLRKYRKVLEQRNALLAQTSVSSESYAIWTEQLLEITEYIRGKRITILQQLEQRVNELLRLYLATEGLAAITLQYTPKVSPVIEKLMYDEVRAKKTLFGAHLDDFICNLHGNSVKTFASRGQQKLIVVLMKIAQIRQKNDQIVLLDDFVTDFDEVRIQALIRLLSDINSQLFFTIPVYKGVLHDALHEYPHQIVKIAR